MAYFTHCDDVDSGFYKVEGWVNKFMPDIMRFSVTMLRNYGCPVESAAEIGVHHGRFFLILEQLCDPSGNCDAFDVFEDQFKNLDGSGRGSKDRFLSNVQIYAQHPHRVRTFKVDSMDLAAGVSSYPKDCLYGLFSIDGCHTALHTCNDLLFAERSLVPGGVVILDDISNMSWMGVFEGAVQYLNGPAPRLAPFAVGFNKLLFTSVGDHARYFDYFQQKRHELGHVPAIKGAPNVTRFKGFQVFRYGQ